MNVRTSGAKSTVKRAILPGDGHLERSRAARDRDDFGERVTDGEDGVVLNPAHRAFSTMTSSSPSADMVSRVSSFATEANLEVAGR